MSKPENISSLSALRERKAELAVESTVARKGLTSTLATTPAKAKDYALEDLAIPALGAGLAIYVGYRLLRSDKREQVEPSRVQQAYEAPQVAENPYAHRQERPVPTAPPREIATSPQPRRVPVTSRGVATAQAAKSGFNFASIMAAGKILVPVVQAVVGIVQNQQSKEQMDEVKQHVEQTKQEVVAGVN